MAWQKGNFLISILYPHPFPESHEGQDRLIMFDMTKVNIVKLYLLTKGLRKSFNDV
jgi:hypothetical protein